MNLSISSQSLAEIVEKLSTQVKQQALYHDLTKKLEFIVDEQEKTISKLKVDVMQMKKAGTVIQNALVPTEDENEKTKKVGVHSQKGIKQRRGSFTKQSKISLYII